MKTAPSPVAGLHDPLEGLVGYQLRRVSLVMAADLNGRLEHLGLTGMSLSVLLMIESNPGITQSELGRELGIKRANMAPVTAQHAERGLIERRATDGRSHGLHLTHSGEILAQSAWTSILENERRFISALSASDRILLGRLLNALRQEEPAGG